MRTVFVDSAYYIALLSPRDQYGHAARLFTWQFVGRMVTTTAIIHELCNALSAARTRRKVVEFVALLRRRPDVEIVHPDEPLWERSLQLYSQRLDKDWSLTDCLSFLVMEERGLTESLTADRHFEQAGFTILL
jgi:predicted nucleic acid-binding protein